VLYWGKKKQEIKCGNQGDMFIETLQNNTKLKLYVRPEFMLFAQIEGEPDPCPNGRIMPPFPDKEDNAMILTKKRPLEGQRN